MLSDGLYEQVINDGMDSELSESEKLSQTAHIDSAEASKVLAKYVAEVVEEGLENIKDSGGDINDQVALTNQIINTIRARTKDEDFRSLTVAERAEQLLALYDRQNTIWAVDDHAKIVRPETSIAQSSLFTGAVHEPQMYTELKKEILSCNRIDMLVSFIKWSGLRLLMDELIEFTQKGGELRVITTSYMGATDVKAIEELRKLPGTKIKVSYSDQFAGRSKLPGSGVFGTTVGRIRRPHDSVHEDRHTGDHEGWDGDQGLAVKKEKGLLLVWKPLFLWSRLQESGIVKSEKKMGASIYIEHTLAWSMERKLSCTTLFICSG